jgi:hypothetical protein
MSTTIRDWAPDRHLETVIEGEAGRIWAKPIREDDIFFDIAKSNHLPANLPDSDNGSCVLDIGQGVKIRASGHVELRAEGWRVVEAYTFIDAYEGGNVTPLRRARAIEIIRQMVEAWACSHPDQLAEAERIYRNNAAHRLERALERVAEDERTLREQLAACESGEAFTQYPKLNSDR